MERMDKEECVWTHRSIGARKGMHTKTSHHDRQPILPNQDMKGLLNSRYKPTQDTQSDHSCKNKKQ